MIVEFVVRLDVRDVDQIAGQSIELGAVAHQIVGALQVEAAFSTGLFKETPIEVYLLNKEPK